LADLHETGQGTCHAVKVLEDIRPDWEQLFLVARLAQLEDEQQAASRRVVKTKKQLLGSALRRLLWTLVSAGAALWIGLHTDWGATIDSDGGWGAPARFAAFSLAFSSVISFSIFCDTVQQFFLALLGRRIRQHVKDEVALHIPQAVTATVSLDQADSRRVSIKVEYPSAYGSGLSSKTQQFSKPLSGKLSSEVVESFDEIVRQVKKDIERINSPRQEKLQTLHWDR
jgi:hypothetical protein